MGEHTLREVLRRRSDDTLRKIRARRGSFGKHPHKKRRGLRIVLWLFILGLLALIGYSIYLNSIIVSRFEESRWSVPARVYARPLELFPGKELSAQRLVRELQRLGYHTALPPVEPGSYRHAGNSVAFTTRSFQFWDGSQPALSIQAQFRNGILVELEQLRTSEPVYLVRLDPALIGSIFPSIGPSSGEDRILVRLEDVPRLLR
ncbi:MAG TPA: penicillin-binding protein 1B, partial [Gammaproteobacteria bacterium]|nr:penicillin-binding protein 1B [Gammaproteobacteria bacterium]